jgi:hypothetical protein
VTTESASPIRTTLSKLTPFMDKATPRIPGHSNPPALVCQVAVSGLRFARWLWIWVRVRVDRLGFPEESFGT